MRKKNKPWVGVDLDGTLAYYDTWKGIEHIGMPIKPMVTRVKNWLKLGIDVRIMTARYATRNRGERYRVRAVIENWCVEHLGQKLRVTCSKDMDMIELWDDRVVQVMNNSGNPISGSTRGLP